MGESLLVLIHRMIRRVNLIVGGGCRLIRKNKFRSFLWISLFFIVLQVYDWVNKEYENPGSLNYFLDLDGKGNESLEYLIDSPRCKIIKMSPWDKAILPFIHPKISPPECSSRNRHWSYVENKVLFLNKTSIEESGYSLNSLRCCYKVILRVEQTLQKNDFNADNEVRYSVECHKMSQRTEISDEFIRVFCVSSSWPFLGEIVYRDFFAIAQPTRESTMSKINYWKAKQIKSLTGNDDDDDKKVIPPSVVMIGIDSLSRMNFHRSFNQTRVFLERIGSVEMLGYTKVGENTHPNTVAFLTGYSFTDLSQSCLRSPEIPQDLCPYLWKQFDEAGYLTATVEDAPGLVGFNYLKLGFVERPTDFYFRPYILAVHKSLPRKDYYHTDCIGRFTTEETLLSYIKGIMNYSSIAPVFVHSWMTSLAHLDINGARFADSKVLNFLQSVDLSNTIVIFLSDHGQRYGAIRETLAGWYEDKLPILTIYIPTSVEKRFPQWKDSLVMNSQRLTSPFDLYKTMEQILKVFSKGRIKHKYENEKDIYGKNISRQYGQSLFNPINTKRGCEDAGVKINYCACLPPKRLEKDDPNLLLAAEAAVAYLNNVIPSQCAKTLLNEVLGGALMENEAEEKEMKQVTYVVTFNTIPGEFMFEANVHYYHEAKSGSKFKITTDLLRMNKITKNTGCVDTSLLERYCYCL